MKCININNVYNTYELYSYIRYIRNILQKYMCSYWIKWLMRQRQYYYNRTSRRGANRLKTSSHTLPQAAGRMPHRYFIFTFSAFPLHSTISSTFMEIPVMNGTAFGMRHAAGGLNASSDNYRVCYIIYNNNICLKMSKLAIWNVLVQYIVHMYTLACETIKEVNQD